MTPAPPRTRSARVWTRAYWRRGVYVHWWGPPERYDQELRRWWAVVLRSDGWRVDGVWIPCGDDDLAMTDYVCLYHAMHFGAEQLRLPPALPAGFEAGLLERAQEEWLAAALGGYLPDAGKNRTMRVRR